MRWWRLSSLLGLVVALGVSGCGKSSASGVAIAISTPSASVITNQPTTFTATVTGSSNTTVTWTLTCATGVTAGTCGSITPATTMGSNPTTYTAPATIPTTTSNGTTTIAPTATITATAQADTSKTSGATITIITGISITIAPSTATVGTNEHFPYTATVSNPGCNPTTNPTCKNVKWSLSTTLTGIGTITVPDPNNPNNAEYNAPGTIPASGSTITITATSVADTSVTATATATLVTAVTPTVTFISPNATALGALFQDIYITGTNFISTNNVYINGAQLDPSNVADVSSTVIRARIPDVLLAAPPASNILQVGVSEQTGAIQTCSNASLCQIAISGVRPGVVGPSPDSVSQQSSSSAALSFKVDGGFFGTSTNPAVTATYDGQLRAIQPQPGGTTDSTRQLFVTIGGSSNPNDLGLAGLHPVAVKSAADPTKFAVTNLAVQTDYTTTAISQIGNRIPVGWTSKSMPPTPSTPSDVAINPATGIVVVANTASNDVSLIDLNASTSTDIVDICTFAVGLAPPCPTTMASGPTSVSVDYVRNIALVANSASKTIAVVDLNARSVSTVVPLPPETPGMNGVAGVPGTPGAVGINPVTGRALIAMQSKNYGLLMDLTVNPPAIVGVVSISTGPKTRVAVEPHLNWAVATPGGSGSITIVDLNQQSSIAIASLSRTNNTVQVTVQTSGPPLTVRPNDAVQITGASDDSFNGIYLVSAIGPASTQFSYTQVVGTGTLPDGTATGGTVNYSRPVAPRGLTPSVQGIGINTETQMAVLVDPATGGVVSFFSLIDQTLSTLSLQTSNTPNKFGPTAATFNPLTNVAVAVDSVGRLFVVDPTSPRQLDGGNPYTNLAGPVALAIDPGTNTAVVVNQTDNSVSILNLGPIRPFSITETSLKTFVTASSLTAGPQPSAQRLTVIGKGLTCVNGTPSVTVRLDLNPLQTSCSGTGDRQLTAIVPPSLLMSAHRYALDVADTSGNVTNAADFTVEQSIDVSSTACPAPQPLGVAVDPLQGNAGIAAVSLFGCNQLALIDMAKSTGKAVNVGSNPIGVAVLPRLALAVVANNGSSNASIVDELKGDTTAQSPVVTGTSPTGAAADEETGEVAIANNVANTVSVVNAQTGAVHSITTGAGPVAVGFNYVNHQVAVADFGSSSLATADGSAGSTTAFATINAPTSVVYDPVPADCGSGASSSTPNTVGCFLANSSTDGLVYILDPVAGFQNAFQVGINPTAIAYNSLTSTLVSTNTSSHTVTVADFLAHRIRAILPLPPIPAANVNLATNLAIAGVPLYALDVHRFSNIAVIADTANGAVLFVPLPR